MKSRTIAVENSTWNNIGDAFYQLSIQRFFSKAFPDATVVSMDGPIERAFKLGTEKFRSKPFEADYYTNADHYVLSGPIIGRNFMRIYAPRIKSYLASGRSYSLISVRCSVTGSALEEVREFLEQHPPRAIYTRDPSSLEKLQGLAKMATAGPCFAFFVRMLSGIPEVKPSSPYLAVSVYTSREPRITCSASSGLSGATVEWQSQPNARFWRYLQHFEWLNRYQTRHEVHGYEFVRPVQGHTPFPNKLFGKPNAYISYNPLCYLGVLKSSEAVISDRVHAGVTGLSFGRPVNIRQIDGRFDLFSGLPLQADGPFWRLDPDFITASHDRTLEWVKKIDIS
ncbi:polysaccharide pyruvyl transferase family protein [Sulfitobacter sp. MOLA879]|uniref:polysaccharide pyruvyl transferase family protein n=1 Tax=Sulfitobacter sp. MOLA879 TaxID=3368579 RepID=UPI0037458BAA